MKFSIMNGEQGGARAALAVPVLLASLAVSVANTALPAIAGAFLAGFAEARWVVVAYLLAVTITVVFAGRLGDQLGRRRVFLGGVALFAAASLLCALAPTLTLLIAARALQGIGAAASIALSQALVTDSVPASRIGGTMGLLGTVSAVGTAFGPSAGGFLIAACGWRSVFLALFALGLAAFALAARCLPSSEGGRRGALSAAPLPCLALLKSGPVLSSLVMNALVSIVMMSTLIVGPFYLSRAAGLGLAEVGLVMSIGPGLSIVSGFPSGKLVDRFGARGIASLGLGFLLAGASAMVLLPPLLGVAGYVAAVALLSPGYQLFLAANGTSLLTAVASGQKGLIAGLLNLSRNLGLVAGASAMGALYAAASGAASGLRATFLAASALALLAFAISLVKPKIRKEPGYGN